MEQLTHILSRNYPVGTSGHVRLVDVMGDDAAIVQAARVSYGAGTKTVQDDRNLIRYLMRNRHTTPFEMCVAKFHIRCPMDTWRQWIRHRTASVNEYSTRYSEAIDEKAKTGCHEWRAQSKSNKQGSAEFLGEEERWPADFTHREPLYDYPINQMDPHIGEYLTARESRLHSLSHEVYRERLEAGVAREQARKDLPLSTYTEAYWKIDLHNLFHFLALRMDSHAQQEIREYATIIGEEIVSRWVPEAWDAFVSYRLDSMTLSDSESMILGFIANQQFITIYNVLIQLGWMNGDGSLPRNRERSEFEEKLKKMAIEVPWEPTQTPPEAGSPGQMTFGFMKEN